MEAPLSDHVAWAVRLLAEGKVDAESLVQLLAPELLAGSSPEAIADSFNRCHAAIGAFHCGRVSAGADGVVAVRLVDQRGVSWRLGLSVDLSIGRVSCLFVAPELPSRAILASWDDLPGLALKFGIPAVSVAFARGAGPLTTRCWGLREADVAVPVTPMDQFQMGSLSKVVCQILVDHLAEKSEIGFDEGVDEYLRSWSIPAVGGQQPRVTIRQLLHHRGAINVPSFPGYPSTGAIHRQLQITDVLAGEPPVRTPPIRVIGVPGVRAAYSGGGYCILQQAIEDRLELSYAEVVAQELGSPIDTGPLTFRDPSGATGWAEGHLRDRPDRHAGLRYAEDAAASLWCAPSSLVELVRSALMRRRSAGRSQRAPIVPTETLREGMLVHTGATGGYTSRLEVEPTSGYVSCIAANTGTGAEVLRAVAACIRAEVGVLDQSAADSSMHS